MIDLQFQYSPFANIKILHEYFDKDAAKHLVFEPTASTKKLLSDLDLLYRRDDTGFQLLADQTMKDRFAKILEDRSGLSFGFWVGNTNPYFSSITEDAPEGLSKVFYFRNGKKTMKDSVLMHVEDFASHSDSVSVLNSGFDLGDANASESLKLVRTNGDVVFEGNLENIQKRTQGLPEGYFEVQSSKGEEIGSFLSLPFTKPKYLVGYIDIQFDKDQIAGIINEVESGNTIPITNFDISFKAKSAYWRYLLVAQYAKSLDKSNLISDQKEIKFHGPNKVGLRGGVEAIEFKSTKPLKMTEYSDLSFQLTAKNGQSSADKILVKRMPLPSVDCLIRAEDNKSSIAEIIFNL